jgi:hypothetical protein
MANIQAEQLVDLTTATLRDLGRLRMTQIATPLQGYEVMSRILRKDKLQVDSGFEIQRNLMVGTSDMARMVGLFQVDQYNYTDVIKQIRIPWRNVTVSYMYEIREMAMQRGANKIVDLIKTRRADAMLSLAFLLEDQFWSAPADSNDLLHLFGVPYWVIKNATAGFNGGDPSGFAAGAGGLTVAEAPRWQNYTDAYTSMSKGDLVMKMRRAIRRMRFVSPVSIDDYRRGSGQRYRIYTTESVVEALENLAEQQNDRLGYDIARTDGQTVFKGMQLKHVWKLDEDTQNPIYFLDFNTFYPVFLRGFMMNESGPAKVPGQHTTIGVDIDSTLNILCTDRRSNGVIYQAA